MQLYHHKRIKMTSKEKEIKFKECIKTLRNNKVMVKTVEDGIYIRLSGDKDKGELFSLEWGKVLSFPLNNIQ